MMRFDTQLRYLTFAEKSYRKDIGRGSRECMREALARFLKVIDRRVPVWTGRSKASVEAAAFFLGKSLDTEITDGYRTRKLKNGKTSRTRYKPKDRRAQGASEGRFKFPASNTTRTFTMHIETRVPYFGLNDANAVNHIFKNLRNTTPWDSFSLGFVAFENYMTANILRFVPRLPDYIRLSTTEQTADYEFGEYSFPARVVESGGDQS